MSRRVWFVKLIIAMGKVWYIPENFNCLLFFDQIIGFYKAKYTIFKIMWSENTIPMKFRKLVLYFTTYLNIYIIILRNEIMII